jgi:hypothetical protein
LRRKLTGCASSNYSPTCQSGAVIVPIGNLPKPDSEGLDFARWLPLKSGISHLDQKKLRCSKGGKKNKETTKTLVW